LLLFGCLALGWLVARFVKLPQGFTGSLNWWVLNIALPALVLELIPRVHFQTQLWFLPVAMWLVFAGAWALFAVLGPMLKWSRARIGAVILAAGLGNTALVGFPLIEALRGKEGVALAVLTDQLGCLIALAIGAITVAAVYSGGRPEPRVIARRILLFPAFHAMILGFIVGALGGWPEALEGLFARVGATLTPVALFSIGAQFNLHLDRSRLGATAAALSWKLALAPLLIYALGMAAGIEGLVLTVAVLQAAMAPMVSTAILADQYGLERDVTSMALGAGILISLFSIPWMSQLLP
jgi:predicted permease